MRLEGKRFTLTIEREFFYIAVRYKMYWTRLLWENGRFIFYRMIKGINSFKPIIYSRYNPQDGWGGIIKERIEQWKLGKNG